MAQSKSKLRQTDKVTQKKPKLFTLTYSKFWNHDVLFFFYYVGVIFKQILIKLNVTCQSLL